MAITIDYIKAYVEKKLKPKDEQKFMDSLVSIANLVIYRHFANLNAEECEDARSEAMVSALNAYKKPYVDFDKYDALHYTYTAMRHGIGNYFRKYKDKEINIDPDIFDLVYSNDTQGVYFETVLNQVRNLYDIEYSSACQQFPNLSEVLVPFDEAIERMTIVDSVLVFKAFKQLREEPVDGNFTPIEEFLEQHRG